MKIKIITAVVILSAAFAACKKKQPETVPVPKAESSAQTSAAVSTAPAVGRNPLAAPGDYLKTTVGQVQKAKAAKALYEKTAKDGLDSLDLKDTGGN
ncbi:MAG: hypothetical protein Q7R35_16320 [Elusimicrobiota bacterium]|nr:hypothetical protein [Elusimicrobiota bacterium]